MDLRFLNQENGDVFVIGISEELEKQTSKESLSRPFLVMNDPDIKSIQTGSDFTYILKSKKFKKFSSF